MHPVIWSSIRVRREKGGTITIEGSGGWTAGPEAGSGDFHNVATYRLLADRIVVVRYKGE